MDIGIFLCRRSTILWSLGRVNEHAGEWAEQNGGGNRWQRMHLEKYKLAKLSVLFEVGRSSFHRHSEGGNQSKKQNKQRVSQISNCYFYYFLFMEASEGPWTGPYSGPWTRSVGRSMDRRPLFSGHPFEYCCKRCSLNHWKQSARRLK